MRCQEFARQVVANSSIHGLSYAARRELHWLERAFWACMVLAASYFSLSSCLNQWQRFRDNPLVYALELAWDKSDLPYAGITMCSAYHDRAETLALIERTWNVSAADEQFAFYWSFLMALNQLRFDTLHTLEPFVNATIADGAHFLRMLLQMRKPVLGPRHTQQERQPPMGSFGPRPQRHNYADAITEAGLCKTSSQLSKYTNPYGEIKELPVAAVKYCLFMAECNTKLLPPEEDETTLAIYLHNVHEVCAPQERSTIVRHVEADSSIDIELAMVVTSAEAAVANLPIAYRKCRYPHENPLKYFEEYRPSLCGIECRIRAALQLCGCKPFFYVVAPREPVCDIRGMLCLAERQWARVNCSCVPLCLEVNYKGLQILAQADDVIQFQRTIIVKMTRPYMAMRRRVVFSTDQLIMSFGGAIGLFLGASFVCVYEVLIQLLQLCARRHRPTGQRDGHEMENGNGH